ncbi:hypothetical protein Taro_022271 [Colocasia esculenta]|uniref:EF-hand domain-containing protein n=1 Tax=Colocasia esculenta TaxID=4460 RepID=A0A843VAU4_COLES|nr:hypothetical protein [Colocasia esculenta]
MKLMATFFSSSSANSGEKGGRRSRRRSMSRSDTPSFGSSTSSGSNDSFSKATAALQTPRSVILGRNASCLDAEYCSSSSSSSVPPAVTELFCVFDRDGDGKITKQELEVVLRRLGKSDPPTEEEVAMMLAEVDRDGDGCISLQDFEALGSALGRRPGGSEGAPPAEEELKDAFGVFDADGDGRISAEELLGVFRALGDDGCTLDDCRRMIGGVDSRGVGFVCFEDFVRMMDGQR